MTEVTLSQATVLGAFAGAFIIIAGAICSALTKNITEDTTARAVVVNAVWFVGFITVMFGAYVIIVAVSAPEIIVGFLK